MSQPKVCVVGLWHLGSVTAACLAHLGYTVVGVDANAERIGRLQQGRAPLFEPGLDDLLGENLAARRLTFTTDVAAAVPGASYVVIAFDTPVDENDVADTSPIFQAAREIAAHLEAGAIVIVSAQVPLGTCAELKALIAAAGPQRRFGLACCPENLRLGQAIQRFLHPDFIVIGADDEATLDAMERFWSPIEAPRLRMNLASAEMTKHALNAFLATTISFANEVANLCDDTDVDAVRVLEAIRFDPRVGQRAMLSPGLGFGGGTLARDLQVLRAMGQRHGQPTPLIDGILTANAHQNGIVRRKLERVYGSLPGLTVTVLGLTYKPGTSTLRRSAALAIIGDLVAAGATVRAHDPKADREEVHRHPEFQFCDDPYEAAQDSDALVIVTDWPQFQDLDFSRIRSLMRRPLIIDSRNMLDPHRIVGTGFQYLGVGRGSGRHWSGVRA